MHILENDGGRTTATVDAVSDILERDGLVVLDGLLDAEELAHARRCFSSTVSRLTWNTQPGFFHTDPYRRMVTDVLRLDESFVRMATHPTVLAACRRYLGPDFIVTEAKGWRSNPSRADFHGWHNDAWYDPSLPRLPRQLKLAVYLSDVETGAFQYRRGSHDRHPHRHWSPEEAEREGPLREVTGRAGTAFLFDSSGVHRQAMPILDERDAVFLVFHDPATPLQAEDLRANRYHPLLLDAASMGALDSDQLRALGVGCRDLVRRGYEAPRRAPRLQRVIEAMTRTHISATRSAARVRARLAGVRG
jgi:hypothetical protein